MEVEGLRRKLKKKLAGNQEPEWEVSDLVVRALSLSPWSDLMSPNTADGAFLVGSQTQHAQQGSDGEDNSTFTAPTHAVSVVEAKF